MLSLVISTATLDKLRDKHSVTKREIEQCFENRVGNFVEDLREEHKTNPPTLWFVAPTNCNRILKIVFIFIDGNIHIKSAFEANDKSIELYEYLGR
ncbi:MAG: ADP-ribosyl-(dinitrogen reductase) hydrolase [Burkholderiales bacterium]|nr:ADP-ribosyl-(dinitrogen reductase) hydrolase [Burkholderiales bacterium]